MPWNQVANIQGGGAPLVNQRTTDTAAINSTTLVDICSVTLEDTGTYLIEALVNVQGSGATNTPGFAIGGTSVPSSWRFAGGLTHATAAAQLGFTASGTTTYPSSGTATGALGTSTAVGTAVIRGQVTVTTAGTLTLRGSRTTGTGTWTAEAGSIFIVTKI